MFSEIWQIQSFEHIIIPNFKIANIYQRTETRGGGVIIFIRDNLKYEKIDSPVIDGTLELTSVLIDKYVISSIYRPPSGSKPLFIEKLTEWIETLRNKQIYIAGDCNLNYHNQDREYYNTLKHNTGITPRITGVTRVISNTCIDNILTDVEGTHQISSICIADHQGLISRIKIKSEREVLKTYMYREMKERNWSIFAEEVSNMRIRGTTINDKWSHLSSDIKKAVEKSFPEKESRVKYHFTMSQGLLKSKNKKNKLLRQYKNGVINKEIYVRYNKIYRKLIATEQQKEFHNKILDCGHNSKRKWKVLKSELKLAEAREDITKLNIDGSIKLNKKEIAEGFKNHFETCASKLAEEVPDSGECEILLEQQNEWGFSAITRADLEKIIDSIQPKSSCGFDLLSNRMLKREKTKFSEILINLINETLLSNVFPEALKIAKVIPIFKKGDRANPNNYRPISLLPVLSKVLEKVLNKQITRKLDELHIIDDNQYGFRSNHSTEDAVMRFIDNIEKAKQNFKFVISIHIDVSKAFDSCNHNILRKKLKKIGMNDKSIELMTSYLKDRVQEFWLDTECGGRFVINIGGGQGTVLGPTLFKIYIADMLLSTNLFSLRFADDSNLIGCGNNKENTEKEINDELSKLYSWFCKNKLTLHPDKSRFIVHTRDKLLNIKLGNKNLMRCGYGLQEEGVKFLGVIIDENLDWKLQIKNVKKKIGKGNYLLWRYKNKLTTQMKKTIYESFVRCHLTYCLSVWGAKKTGELANLKKLIKKIWSKIGLRRQHTNERLMEHNILKLEDELRTVESKTIWRWEKKKIPLGLQYIIEEKLGRNLRQRQFVRATNWKHDSIAYRLATRAIKEIKDIEIAKTKKGLAKKIRNTCLLIDYAQPCRVRNCLYCHP